jgi:predicted DNA-binding transcriptional regulator YafY
MNRIQRITLILGELRKNELTAEKIKLFMHLNKHNVSLRQIQRDLKELPLFLNKNEYLNLSKIDKTVFYSILENQPNNKISLQNTYLLETKFYNQIISPNILKVLKAIELAIKENKSIVIQCIKNDQTGDNDSFETKKFEFQVTRIILHRNNYYIAGWNPNRQMVQIFGATQLFEVSVTNKTFDFNSTIALVEDELKKRFGVTRNINEEVYDIALEIPEVLASFIKNNHWHDSQRFSVKNSKTIMHLKCGVNRELMGWLFQWMYNIRIIKPPILADYYQKTINEIQKNCNSNKPLVYRNIFETKEE